MPKCKLPLIIALCALAACQTAAPGTSANASNYASVGGISRPITPPSMQAPPYSHFLIDAWKGNPTCAALKETDYSQDALAEHRACNAPIGQKVTWNNPDTGASGTIVAVNDGYNAQGAYCREFEQSLTISDHQIMKHTHACQRQDGSWATTP